MFNWLAVGIGGALGSMARYGIAVLIGTHFGSKWPWATFIANVLGCLIIGALYVVLIEKNMLPEQYRALLMVGFLGGLTTFSTFSLEVVRLIELQEFQLAAMYSIGSMLICLVCVWGTILLMRTLYS